MKRINVRITAAPVEKEKFIQIGTIAEFIRNIAKTDDLNTFTEVLDNTLHFAKDNKEYGKNFCFKAMCFIDGPEKMLPESKTRSIGQREIWSPSDDGTGITKTYSLEVFQYQGKSWVRASDYEAAIFQ